MEKDFSLKMGDLLMFVRLIIYNHYLPSFMKGERERESVERDREKKRQKKDISEL